MNLEYNQLDVLETELEALPPLHRIAFAASCCERLLPNYNIYAREAAGGDPVLLRTVLDEVWQILEGKQIDEAKLRQWLSDCRNDDKIFPEDTEYLPEAERTVEAICSLLKVCLKPTAEDVVRVAKQVKETLWEFLYWKFDEESDSWGNKPFQEEIEDIAFHPLTVREMAKQSSDLQRLKEKSTLDRDFLNMLRTSSYNDGKSLLDLS